MGMEASTPSPGSDPRDYPLENVEIHRARGFENGVAGGLSGEMGKEADNGVLARTPTRFLVESRNDRGNEGARVDPRDGFPRGFSVSRRMVINRGDITREEEESMERGKQGAGEMETTTPDMDSSRSMAIYFDSEQMDRGLVDDSPVYGSVGTELTPIELGSFHVRGDGGEESDDTDVVESQLDATVGALSFQEEDDPKRRIFTKRKKGKVVKSQLHADFVLGAEKSNGGSKREGYISSRLYAKPLAARVRLRNPKTE